MESCLNDSNTNTTGESSKKKWPVTGFIINTYNMPKSLQQMLEDKSSIEKVKKPLMNFLYEEMTQFS